MNRLATQFATLRLSNPIILGSGPSTDTFDDIRRGEDAGAGAVITKSIGKHAPTAFQPTDQRRYRWKKGLGCHLKSTYLKEILSLDFGCDLIRRSKESCSFPVIGSVFYPSLQTDDDVENWKSLVRAHEMAGADAVQLDFFYIDLRKLSDERIAQICSYVVAIIADASIPVFPKVNTGMDDDLIRALYGLAEAPGYIMIDSIRCEPIIDVDRGGAPIFDGLLHKEGRSISVIAGEPLLPFTLSYTQRAARTTSRPLCSGGGLSSADHIMQCMMVGATCVHITSFLMRRGLNQIRKLCTQIERKMDQIECGDVATLIGKSLNPSPNVSERMVMPTPNLEQQVRLIVDKCIHCEICERLHVCDSFLKFPYEFDHSCDGCTMCVDLCPPGALVLEPLKASLDRQIAAVSQPG
jgi:dihydroorotate dehydrogenase